MVQFSRTATPIRSEGEGRGELIGRVPRLVGGEGEGDGVVAHGLGELEGEVAEAADAGDADAPVRRLGVVLCKLK